MATTVASPSDIDVTIVLVSFNTSALLANCLDRLDAATRSLRTQILVVDNASRDDSVSVLRARGDRIELAGNDVNVGFGRANNQVLSEARGRFVLLLNTDAWVEPDTLTTTLAYMAANERCGVLGVRLTGEQGDLQPSCRYFPTPVNEFVAQAGLGRLFPSVRLVDDLQWDHASNRDCDWVPGCYYLIRREVIDAVGLFDPRYFLYFEEVDHCRAVRDAGWHVAYFAGATVVHLGGESAKSEASSLSQGKQISRLQLESAFLYFRKHHGRIGAWAALVLGWCSEVVVALRDLRRSRGFGETLRDAARRSRLQLEIFHATLGGRRATR